jgi:hypothetical protein
MFDLVVKDLNSMQEVLSSIIFSIVKQKYIYHVIVNLSWCFYFKTYHVKALLSCPFFTPQHNLSFNKTYIFISLLAFTIFSSLPHLLLISTSSSSSQKPSFSLHSKFIHSFILNIQINGCCFV